MSSWKLQDSQAENSMAHNYDYIYNRTRFAKMMYSDFARQVDKLLQQGQTVLEIGCGTGTVSSLLHSDVKMHGLDLSRNMLVIAKGKKQWDTLVEADIDHLPYANHSFEVVMAHSAIHHFPSFEVLLREIVRVLRPGGYFVVQEPNNYNFRKAFFMRALGFALRKIGLKRYPDVAHLEIKPSEHHAPLPMKTLVDAIERSQMQIRRSELRYFSSSMVQGFDSPLTHAFGKLLDSYYVKKYQTGYMYAIVAQV